jgi:peptide/nickel transport system permease protein
MHKVILGYAGRKLVAGALLLFGVTLISFTLMVHFGPDPSFQLAGKNPTDQQLDEIREQLGHKQPFLIRYVRYLGQLVTLDFGYSDSSGEQVGALLARTVPVSMLLMLPGFVLGNVLSIGLALLAAAYRGTRLDRAIMATSVAGMSTSFLIIIIACQIIFSSSYGLDWFPVRGWNTASVSSYLNYVSVPTLAIVLVSLGYHTRFYRTIFVAELSRDYVRTARAYGLPAQHIYFKQILKNSLIPLSTRIMFSIPMVVVGGSLLIESYFGIPGIGKVTFDAITSGDQPVLKAVVALTAVLFVLVNIGADIIYHLVDPRVQLR